MAPVSRMMVRQPQSKANAGAFNNGMPMTSSMGCGIWGGNITNENIALKHYMQVTWVSRPIAEDKPLRGGIVRRVLQLRDFRMMPQRAAEIDVLVSEVGPRDGLQSIARTMPTEIKHRWIARWPERAFARSRWDLSSLPSCCRRWPMPRKWCARR